MLVAIVLEVIFFLTSFHLLLIRFTCVFYFFYFLLDCCFFFSWCDDICCAFEYYDFRITLRCVIFLFFFFLSGAIRYAEGSEMKQSVCVFVYVSFRLNCVALNKTGPVLTKCQIFGSIVHNIFAQAHHIWHFSKCNAKCFCPPQYRCDFIDIPIQNLLPIIFFFAWIELIQVQSEKKCSIWNDAFDQFSYSIRMRIKCEPLRHGHI